MLIGHYAPALLLKTRSPRVPLWVLFLAVEGLDYLWSFFVLAGLEHLRIVPGANASNGLELYDMPLSHSLAAATVWSLLGGATAAFAWRKRGGAARAGLAVGLAVASHYALDLVVHVRDLPLLGSDSPRLGFGLWNYKLAALAVETALVLLAVVALERSPTWTPRSRGGYRRLAAFMTLFCVASYFLPTPGSPYAMAASGLVLYVLLTLAAWRVEGPAEQAHGVGNR